MDCYGTELKKTIIVKAYSINGLSIILWIYGFI